MVIMTDPVLLPDGQSYERAAITAWLAEHGTSPVTRQPISADQIVTNFALKSLIERYLGVAVAPMAPVALEGPPELSLTVKATSSAGGDIHVRVQPGADENRPPLVIIGLLDVSGSMSANCAEKMDGTENVEITRLQLVQSSLKTVINSLDPSDGLVLFSFNSAVAQVLPLTRMDEAGRGRATAAVNGLRENGMTNIYAALAAGAARANEIQAARPWAIVQVMLFTDGEPTENPPRGILPEFQDRLAEAPERRWTLSTFSYGYSIDSALMERLARLGDGVYGYCPDSTMVGTIFVNFLSQSLNCVAQRAQIEIGAGGALLLKEVRSLHVNHPLNFIVRGDPAKLRVKISVPSTKQVIDREVPAPSANPAEMDALHDQVYRTELVDMIIAHLQDPATGLRAVRTLNDGLLGEAKPTPFQKALAVDLIDEEGPSGQVGKGFDAKFFKKWGKDYLRGFARFHELETCGNFKDESLQLYQTAQFGIRRRQVNRVFMALPPIEGKVRPPPGAAKHGPQQYQAVSSAQYYSRWQACWSGDAQVALAGGAFKKTRDLAKGDELKSGGKVLCVVEQACEGEAEAVKLGDAWWTPWHPVKSAQGVWVFATDERPITKTRIDAWFNLVVSGSPFVEVGGIETVGLGHGLTEGVLLHPYWATNRVVEALAARPGFEAGRVKLTAEDGHAQRDADGLVCSFY
jgi:Mg-chelatase subunit ChlD